jgi:poly-gamma-glutamate capsule biosynthesis protein CapA/YwtB (metallophosphatase superfamily)
VFASVTKEVETTLFLCGDVMTGRGIDQVLPHHNDPRLHEAYVGSALEYVELAERVNGPIPAPVDFDYLWGAALAEFERNAPDARIINLETSVTTSDAWQAKGIHYRMHPGNVECLTCAGLDCAVLANNHVLDWGPAGLEETLNTLHAAGLRTAGAGHDRDEAWSPAVVPTPGRRILVFAFGTECSGVQPSWSAELGLGVGFLPELSRTSADVVAEHVLGCRQPGDLVVLSIHWGSNWGYRLPRGHRAFAHRLMESGAVDVIHGHSSHHPRAMEVYRNRLILYGCGDFLNDYEGISGYESYRGDLSLMYFVTLGLGDLTRVRMVPLHIRRFQLERATESDTRWLQRTLDRESKPFGVRVELGDHGDLELLWR